MAGRAPLIWRRRPSYLAGGGCSCAAWPHTRCTKPGAAPRRGSGGDSRPAPPCAPSPPARAGSWGRWSRVRGAGAAARPLRAAAGAERSRAGAERSGQRDWDGRRAGTGRDGGKRGGGWVRPFDGITAARRGARLGTSPAGRHRPGLFDPAQPEGSRRPLPGEPRAGWVARQPGPSRGEGAQEPPLGTVGQCATRPSARSPAQPCPPLALGPVPPCGTPIPVLPSTGSIGI